MSEYKSDIEKYTDEVYEDAVSNIAKYCGIALRNKDSSYVAASDKKELDTVKNGFAKKKLGLSPEQADAGIAEVCAQMKGTRAKHRVTFYYLLAKATNTLDKVS